MSTLILVILFRFVATVISAVKRRARGPQPKPLCTECAFAHIQFAACGRRAISCTYGGGVRPMTLDVLYCTDYRSRAAPVRKAIGFMCEIASAD